MARKIALWRGIKVFLYAYFLALILLLVFQKYLLFHPKVLPAKYNFVFDEPHEEIWLGTPDGEKINSIRIKSTTNTSKGVVLYFHGNADDLRRWGKYHADFTSRGYDFVAMDYRGFGKSSGDIDEQKYYEDALLLYNWCLERYPAEAIVLYGRSLGTGIATQLASKVSAKILMLETPYTSIKAVLSYYFSGLPFPERYIRYNFNTLEYIRHIKAPIVAFHGTKDWIIPYNSTQPLQSQLIHPHQFITISGGNHKNLYNFPLYQEALDEIIGTKLKKN